MRADLGNKVKLLLPHHHLFYFNGIFFCLRPVERFVHVAVQITNNQINKTAAARSAIFFVIIYLPFFAGKSLMNLCAGRSSFVVL